MKTLLGCFLTLMVTANAWADSYGMVTLTNRVMPDICSYVYAPDPDNPTLSLTGNGPDDAPSGSQLYPTMAKIGAVGAAGQYGGDGTFAQLFAANGGGRSEGDLLASTPITTFRTDAAAGFLRPVCAVLSNVPADAPLVTVQLRVWDNSSGLYPTWDDALAAWNQGLIAAGKSNIFDVGPVGGLYNTNPNTYGLESFNIYYQPTPEPSTIALLVLGIAGLARRRTKS